MSDKTSQTEFIQFSNNTFFVTSIVIYILLLECDLHFLFYFEYLEIKKKSDFVGYKIYKNKKVKR